MDKLNVHNYDNKLNIEIIKYINSYTEEINKTILQDFFNEFIKINGNNSSSNGLYLIINEKTYLDNIDNLNQLDARKILQIIINIYNKSNIEIKKNIIEVIKEQMEDMFNTGQCSQGRTIRLFQILSSFIEL